MSASPPPSHIVDEATATVGAENVPANALTLAGDEDEDVTDNEEPARPRLAFPKQPVATAPAVETADGESQDAADIEAEGNEEETAEAPEPAGGLLDDSASDDSDGDRIPRYKKSKKRAGSGSGDDDRDESDEEYAAAKKSKKAEKRRKKDRAARAGKRAQDELPDDDARVLEQDDAEPEIDEETRKRMRRENMIDAVGKNKKQVRRRKKGEEDIMDSAYEETCTTLRNKMVSAAQQDVASRQRREPAMAKLAMLDEVMAVLRNQTMWQAIVDSQLLEAVRMWLEPSYVDLSASDPHSQSLDDPSSSSTNPQAQTGYKWSLPAVGIQRAIFEVLPKMDLDTPTLKECRLGPVVYFYTKTKRCPPQVKRQAEELVQIWSRPIAKRPVDFRQRRVQHAQPRRAVDGEGDVDMEGEGGEGEGEGEGEGYGEGEEGEGEGEGAGGSQSQARASQSQGGSSQRFIQKKFNVAEALKENQGRKGARLPVVKAAQYTVVPESRVSHGDESTAKYVNRLQQDNRKFNKFARSLKMTGKK